MTFPPLPQVPESPIFDPPYETKLRTLLNDSAFPAGLSPEDIYDSRLEFIETILAIRIGSSRSLSIALLVAWTSMVLLCSFLLVRIRFNRQRALFGDPNAAHKIILPAFEPLLWMLGGLNFALIVSYTTLLVVNNFIVYHNRLWIEVTYGAKQINALFVVTYMMQPSLALRALAVAACLAIVLSGYTIPVVVLLNTYAIPANQSLCYWALMSSRGLLGLLLLYIIAYPPARASITWIRILCGYVLCLILLMYWMTEAYHHGNADMARIVGWVIAGYSMLLPLCVWHVLRTDTEHWRGVGQRAVELQATFRRRNGRIEEHVSSQGLHVLIEMHRKFIIDFSRLQFGDSITHDDKKMVYRGFLHSTKKTSVAIKVYMPTDFTEETVAEYSHEAALCGTLVHPNIVKFYGLCVSPPNICLVTELCDASLHNILKFRAARDRHRHIQSSSRQHMLVNMGYMIDAARAVAYLHSFSPPFVHCNIKPSHYLLDADGTIKLTDFGASRTLENRAIYKSNRHAAVPVGIDVESEHQSGDQTTLRTSTDRLAYFTPEYVAPELIHGQEAGMSAYGEAADIFSLAMVMWDILHAGKIKYLLTANGNSRTSSFRRNSYHHLHDRSVYEMVLAGHRPPLDPSLHPGLRDLFTTAWHSNPQMRPTAQALVVALEAIQDELCAPFAIALVDELNGRTSLENSEAGLGSVTGLQAVEKLCALDAVDSHNDAIRLGNMLMDCGYLHHTKHARCFEYSRTEYVFDVDRILGCQRLVILESEKSSTVTPCNGERDPDGRQLFHSVGTSGCERPSSAVSHVTSENSCGCRRLGQRLDVATSRFRLKFRFRSHENTPTTPLLPDDGSDIPMTPTTTRYCS